jgi:anti-sigma regulatory factor (Ser/Thr protein kinase)
MLVVVREDLDVFEARRTARRLAVEIGFDVQAREELAIAVSELASNIIKYGIAGDILFERVKAERWGSGIRVTARDTGPPIADVTLAIRDGYSDTGPIDPLQMKGRKGFGCGLGAVVRFSDWFEYRAGEGEKRICIVRYARRPPANQRGVAP